MAQKIPVQAKLLLGISLVIGASVLLHFRMKSKETEDREKQANSPKVRVERALATARQATINRRYREAEEAYGIAYEAIGEALEERPKSLKLRRSQLVVLRQLTHWSSHRKDAEAGYKWAKLSVEVAKDIMTARPTETRARRDRLATAIAFAGSGSLAEPDALDVLRDAVKHVGRTAKDAPPTPAVRELLARAWLAIGKGEGEARESKAAFEALRQALRWSRSGTTADEHRYSIKSLGYTIAVAGTEIAKALDHRAGQEEFESEAISALILGTRLSSKDAVLQGMLAARRARLADLLQARGDLVGAAKLHRAATKSLEEAVNGNPQKERLRLSWVRALNHEGAFYSASRQNKESVVAYEKACEAAKALTGDGLRARLISMGNYAQLLGRLDRVIAARKIGGEAYILATELADKNPDKLQKKNDRVSAGLRLARLLRAPPNAKRADALSLARKEQKALLSSVKNRGPSKREKRLIKGLRELITELNNR